MKVFDGLSETARGAPDSGIIELVGLARQSADFIPLWVGQGVEPTPEFIRKAAVRSLMDGETFYPPQAGEQALRECLARYHQRIYGRSFGAERFSITCSGMHAIQLALQVVTDCGDEIVIPTPAWPNFIGAAGARGARAVRVSMEFVSGKGWALDPVHIRGAMTKQTRAIFLNSPSNPTGWVASPGFLEEILTISRETGVWIIADEIYNRFFFGEADRAPSLYDLATEEDRVVFVNSFSKNWAMTGWRVGWISAPAEISGKIANLIQYSTSGVSPFVQKAACAALDFGEEFVDSQKTAVKRHRLKVTEALVRSDRFEAVAPEGSFYLFFRANGVRDTYSFARELVSSAGVGIAPGTAFGPGGEEFMRLCCLLPEAQLLEAVQRMVRVASGANSCRAVAPSSV